LQGALDFKKKVTSLNFSMVADAKFNSHSSPNMVLLLVQNGVAATESRAYAAGTLRRT
jgi:hypothetical protein